MFFRPAIAPRYSSNPQDKAVFQLFQRHGEITPVYVVREVFEMCQYIPTKASRDAVYAMNGLDGDNVEKYLTIVENLNRLYKM